MWVKGICCEECGSLVGGQFWKPWLIGVFLGFLCGLSVFLWRSSLPSQPPLPVLTTLAAQGSPPTTTLPSENGNDPAKTQTVQLEEVTHLCGAPTKSGHPCRRKVKGTTGYCWQHRK